MVKDVSSDYCFNSPWKETVEGAFHKYPNEVQSNVASVDILAREIDTNGNLVTKKLIRSHFRPNKAMQFIMPKIGIAIKRMQSTLECSSLDLAKRRYLMRSLNNTYCNHISCYEVMEYLPHPEDNAKKTILTQKAEIDMYVSDYHFSMQWAVNKGEGLFASEYLANSQKGRVGLESVILKLKKEWEELEELAKKIPGEVEEFSKKCINDGTEVAKKAINDGAECAKTVVEICAEATLGAIDERARR